MKERIVSLLAELSVIVVGVLIALGVENWNEDRIERQTEADYLRRLASDVEADTATFSFVLSLAEAKSVALSDVAAVLSEESDAPLDTLAFLSSVARSSSLGWQTPLPNRATFEDLVSTGNLSLIRDTELRDQVTQYYRLQDNWIARVNGRRGAYPQVTYRLVRRAPGGRVGEGDFGVHLDDSALPPSEMIARIKSSDLSELLPAEQNLALFVEVAYTSLREDALVLLDALGRDGS